MRTPFPCLWFDGKAEEAAEFYTRLLPGSSVDKVWRSPADTPSGPAGMVLTVDFTLNGQHFQGLNGGPDFSFNEAVSFVVECEDQAEVDRLWDALTANGGEPGPCGWLKDRFGLSWQIVPRQLNEAGWRSRSGACAPRQRRRCSRWARSMSPSSSGRPTRPSTPSSAVQQAAAGGPIQTMAF